MAREMFVVAVVASVVIASVTAYTEKKAALHKLARFQSDFDFGRCLGKCNKIKNKDKKLRCSKKCSSRQAYIDKADAKSAKWQEERKKEKDQKALEESLPYKRKKCKEKCGNEGKCLVMCELKPCCDMCDEKAHGYHTVDDKNANYFEKLDGKQVVKATSKFKNVCKKSCSWINIGETDCRNWCGDDHFKSGGFASHHTLEACELGCLFVNNKQNLRDYTYLRSYNALKKIGVDHKSLETMCF